MNCKIMRFFSKMSLMSLFLVALSCQKESDKNTIDSSMPEIPESVAKIEIVDGMLSFPNDSMMYDGIIALSSMSSDVRAEWEADNNFESMQTLCDRITSELEQVEDEEGFYDVRSVYDDFVFFGEPNTNDQAFYVPLDKMFYSQVVDINGNVKVGNEIRSYKSDSLMNRIKSMDCGLKSYGDDLDYCKKFRSKDRQLICLLEELEHRNFVHLYVSSQKHSWWRGWINNSSLKRVKNTGRNAVYFASSRNYGENYYNDEVLPERYTGDDVEYLHKYFVREQGKAYSFLVFGNSFVESEACTLSLAPIWNY